MTVIRRRLEKKQDRYISDKSASSADNGVVKKTTSELWLQSCLLRPATRIRGDRQTVTGPRFESRLRGVDWFRRPTRRHAPYGLRPRYGNLRTDNHSFTRHSVFEVDRYRYRRVAARCHHQPLAGPPARRPRKMVFRVGLAVQCPS